jgi:excinuclease ABC subunit C
LIYVGKAKSLRGRLLSYFRPKSRDPKAGRILEQTRAIVWEAAPSEFAALLRELELIRRWQPRCNVQGRPGRRRHWYVCLGRRPAPYAFLSARPPRGTLACFGPVPAGRQAREGVRRLNDWFQLRDCPRAQEMIFADQGELFPVLRAAGCIRHEIGTCSAPCAAACTHTAYQQQVRDARTFLEGTDDSPLRMLESEMTAAAQEMAYEREAELRDRRETLTWLRERIVRLRRACEKQSFVYRVLAETGEETWYLIHHGQVMAAVPAPVDDAGRARVAAELRSTYRHRAGLHVPRADEVDGILLVAGWFHRHPEERARTLTPSEAATLLQGESAGLR